MNRESETITRKEFHEMKQLGCTYGQLLNVTITTHSKNINDTKEEVAKVNAKMDKFLMTGWVTLGAITLQILMYFFKVQLG